MSDDWKRSVAVGDRALWVPAPAPSVSANGHAPISEEPVRPSEPVSADRPADTGRPDGQAAYRRSGGDRVLDGLGAAFTWLASVDWLSAGAFVLTIGAFLGAALDSYTSLCTVGGDLAHIGQASSCPDVHGWDTRTFPLAVDMGWGGGLLATVRLARLIGIANWRWVAVLAFEMLVAGTTVAGNAVHGMILVSSSHWLPDHPVRVAVLASSVPGVVAVGAGFTLSVLISTRKPAPDPVPESLGAARRVARRFVRSPLAAPASEGAPRTAPTERAQPRPESAPSARTQDAPTAPRSRAQGPRPDRAQTAPRPRLDAAPKRRAPAAPKRVPRNARQDQMRALLGTPDGAALTSEEMGARLGIDAGYARKLRAEVERAQAQEENA